MKKSIGFIQFLREEYRSDKKESMVHKVVMFLGIFLSAYIFGDSKLKYLPYIAKIPLIILYVIVFWVIVESFYWLIK